MDRRIDPTRRPASSNDRVEIGPTALALAEWEAAGLAPPDLPTTQKCPTCGAVMRLGEPVCDVCGTDVRAR